MGAVGDLHESVPIYKEASEEQILSCPNSTFYHWWLLGLDLPLFWDRQTIWRTRSREGKGADTNKKKKKKKTNHRLELVEDHENLIT